MHRQNSFSSKSSHNAYSLWLADLGNKQAGAVEQTPASPARSRHYEETMGRLKERNVRHGNKNDLQQLYASDVSAIKKLTMQEQNGMKSSLSQRRDRKRENSNQK